jgi:hypothetical protein
MPLSENCGLPGPRIRTRGTPQSRLNLNPLGIRATRLRIEAWGTLELWSNRHFQGHPPFGRLKYARGEVSVR